ncbi:hypothetical protein GPEL0_01r4331 [Geoanaerobacter pelophilus]|uniref:Uncharacterized protein n=1 Tax=Geoanaerobacter pelophilus TaxID=60036 RepID=A0ABQ0MM29_9BACT|nr:hypothetical protein GPEL0_01r4331 [Geoanaerobacter pelophilus]
MLSIMATASNLPRLTLLNKRPPGKLPRGPFFAANDTKITC